MNKLSPELIKKLSATEEPEKIKLSTEEQKKIDDAVEVALMEMVGLDKLQEVDPKEVEAINKLSVTIEGSDETQNFTDVFGEGLARMISMTQEVETKEGKLMIKKGGKFVEVKNAKELADFVPKNLKTDYEDVLAGDKDMTPDKFKEKGNKASKHMEAISKLKQMADNPETRAMFKKMGIADVIGSLVQLWQMFQEAMKTGDFQSLQDGLTDFQLGRNPMERMKAAKKDYMDKVNGSDKHERITDTGELLTLYNEPYGPKANKLFTDDKLAPTPYRIQLKSVIKERIQKDLGVEIIDMEGKDSPRTTIICRKKGEKFKIVLERDEGETRVTMEKAMTHKDGSEYFEETDVKGKAVKDTTGGTESLAYMLFKEEPGKPGAEKPREKIDYDKLTTEDMAKRKEIKQKNPKQLELAKKNYKEGKELLAKEDYPKALAKFKKAEEIYPFDKPKYRIALCLDKLGRKDEALTAYNHYLNPNMNPNSKEQQKDDIDHAEKRVRELEEELGVAKPAPEAQPPATPASAPAEPAPKK